MDIFDPIKRQTTRKVEILENLTIKLKIENKEVEIKLEKGQQILIFKFYWYQEAEIIQQIVDQGFAIDQFCTNQDASCALMMVKPSKIK